MVFRIPTPFLISIWCNSSEIHLLVNFIFVKAPPSEGVSKLHTKKIIEQKINKTNFYLFSHELRSSHWIIPSRTLACQIFFFIFHCVGLFVVHLKHVTCWIVAVALYLFCFFFLFSFYVIVKSYELFCFIKRNLISCKFEQPKTKENQNKFEQLCVFRLACKRYS